MAPGDRRARRGAGTSCNPMAPARCSGSVTAGSACPTQADSGRDPRLPRPARGAARGRAPAQLGAAIRSDLGRGIHRHGEGNSHDRQRLSENRPRSPSHITPASATPPRWRARWRRVPRQGAPTVKLLAVDTMTDADWEVLDARRRHHLRQRHLHGQRVGRAFRPSPRRPGGGAWNGAWRDKVAAGFTNSGAKSGDKLQLSGIPSGIRRAAPHALGQPRPRRRAGTVRQAANTT